MSEQPKKITRKELYQKVWTTTLKIVAEELGLGYSDLVRICEELNVPRPVQGHWQRLKLGLPVEQIALPDPGPDTPLEALLETKRERAKAEAPVVDEGLSTKVPGVTSRPAPQECVPQTAPPKPQVPAKPEVPPVPEPAAQGTVVYTRKQLYEAIWTTPCQKLAAALGISDVALAKTCKRLGIPRPSLGYWARIAVGEKLPKIPLPAPNQGQEQVVTFDVAANLQRRKEWAEASPRPKDLEELAVRLELPEAQTQLHPLALKHHQMLEKAKPGEDSFVRVNKKELFQCGVAPSSIPRLCRALHALFGELEARGYKFQTSKEDYGNLRIVEGSDWASLQISESQEQIEREPTTEEKRKPSWTWQLKKTRPTGKLSFEIHAWGLKGRRTWTEADNKPIEEVLGIVVEKIEATFRGFEEQRQREAELAKRREIEEKEAAKRRAEEEARRIERERLRQHEAKLAAIAESRRQNLFVAARQWMDAESLLAFIEVCESQWRQAGGTLSQAQSEWLKWARSEAAQLTPFAKGYPDPVSDGAFDAKSVPQGGPYPKTRSLDEEKPSASPPTEVRTVYVDRPQPKQQYPFWLLHRKH